MRSPLLSSPAAVLDQPDAQPLGGRPRGSLVRRRRAGRLQQPHLRHALGGHSGQNRDLGPDQLPGPLEPEQLQGAAAQAARAGAPAGAAEPQGAGADGQHRGSDEGEGVPGPAAEEPGAS